MKIAIVGSRNFKNLEAVDEYIASLPKDTEIVSGGARGVDRTTEQSAKKYGLATKIFYANWDNYGRGAGMIRNHQIVDYADEVVAFWDGSSKGTKHTIDLAYKQSKNVIIFKEE